MSIFQAKAKKKGNGWWLKCPECETRFKLDECPAPGGMDYNVEFCPECGIGILVISTKEVNKAWH